MSLPELATPIRIYWDITPLADPPVDLLGIAAQIIDVKILNVDLTATGSLLPASCGPLLARFAASRIGLTLTISPAALPQLLAAVPPANLPRDLLLEMASVEELADFDTRGTPVTGISFPLAADNWGQLAEVIALCSSRGLTRLVLPMQRLYSGAPPFHLTHRARQETAGRLAAMASVEGLRITVHDPFAWRAIFPRTPFPEGRCQAANTMLAIDSRGLVYPCPVMPLPLGDLRTTSLKEIVRSAAKKELRRRILQLPGECAACADAESCKGGCRGRAERIFGWDGIDPGCR